MRKRYIGLPLFTLAALLLISLTPTTQVSYTDFQISVISSATDTGGGFGFATAIDRTPAYATERPTDIVTAAGMRSDTPILAPDRYATGRNHRFDMTPNTFDYIDLAGANMDDTTAPTTSTATFRIRT